MKKRFFSLFCLVVLLIAGPGSIQAQEKTPEFNELNVNHITVFLNKGKTTGQKFNVRDTPANLISAFGKPKTKTIEFFEIDQLDYTVYRYEGAEFQFDKDSLVYFRITSNRYKILTQIPAKGTRPDKYLFKVGDPISRLQPVFPKSYGALNSDGLIFFHLFRPDVDPKSKKPVKTRLDTGLVLFSKNDLITDFIYEH